MDKKLPSVFVTNSARMLNANNKKVFYSFYKNNNVSKKYNEIDIRKKINDVFSSSTYNYKVDATIITKNGEELKETFVSKNYDYLLTIDGKRILINDIVDIN